MCRDSGQATIEWTGLALLVTIVIAAAAVGAQRLGTAGLPQRLACGLLGERCGPRPLTALSDGPSVVFYGRVPVHDSGPLATAATALSPGVALGRPVVEFVKRHGKLIRKVVVATAIGAGVAATCAGAVVAANAIGGAMCGSAIVTGGVAAYHNATD